MCISTSMKARFGVGLPYCASARRTDYLGGRPSLEVTNGLILERLRSAVASILPNLATLLVVATKEPLEMES